MIERLNTALEGRYRIERELGEGGMAYVFLASDLKHDRRVALKVLKPELAAVVGADRFLAEIKTTANLQHPHILPLFDSGEDAGFLWYAMPYLEGDSLRDRLDQERQLPVEEAVAIARKVAGALLAAHEQGVIHRDIKPANILMQRGEPVVADFGIALAVSAGVSGRLTETGLSMGTPYYMSPEQATGDQVPGPATDIFALGCVLYEMLAGDPPYPGSTAQAVLGKIIQSTPVSATEARASVPPHVDAVIRRALEKIPADRFGDAGAMAQALGDPAFRHGAEAAGVHAATGGRWKAIALAATVLAVGSLGTLAWSVTRPEPEALVERFASPLPNDLRPSQFVAGRFSMPADGSKLAYVAGFQGEGRSIVVRSWTDPEPRGFAGTGGASRLAFSPDGSRLAYRRDREVFILTIDAGTTVELGQGQNTRWSADDEVFMTVRRSLVRRRLDGSTPVEVISSNDFEVFEFDLLPGASAAVVGNDDRLWAVDFRTGERKELVAGWLPAVAASGHLMYLDAEDRLLAVRFDFDRLEIVGTPSVIVDEVADFALSESGKLFYAHLSGGQRSEFVWVSRDGRASPVLSGWTFDRGGVNPGWSLSPDGSLLAYRELNEDGNNDIWVRELPDGPLRRLTTDVAQDQSPRWSPDGSRITFVSGRGGGGNNVWEMQADGTGTPELIYDDPFDVVDATRVPDSDWMVLRTYPGSVDQRGRDIVAIRPGQDTVATQLLTETYDEKQPAISPDGRWLAYTSTETGKEEIFVRPFPDVESGKTVVSTNGGIMPVWGREGTELFYVDDDNQMVSATFATDPSFRVIDWEVLFTLADDVVRNASNILFSTDLGDERFLMARTLGGNAETVGLARTMLVNNFLQVLRERLPNR